MEAQPWGEKGTLESSFQQDLSATFELWEAHFRRVSVGWTYPRHDHPGFELNYLIAGEQDIRLTGRSLRQRPGDLVLFAPGDAHANRNAGEGPMSYYCLHFELDDPLLRQLLCLAGTRHYLAEDAATQMLAPHIQRLVALTREPSGVVLADRLESISGLFELLSALARVLATQLDAAPPVSPTVLQTASRLAGWIAEQVETPANEQSLESMIARLGYGAAHGTFLFTKVYGMSPRQYRSQLKFKRARLLLLDSNLSVQRVADMLGYADVAHFSRQYKRWSGVSPLEWRQAQYGRGEKI